MPGEIVTNYLELADISKFNKLLRLSKPFDWYTQKVLFQTHLFGKDYFWMKDVDGTIYLAKVGANGLPDLS